MAQLRGGNYPEPGTFRPRMTALGPKHASMALWYVGGPSRYQTYLGDVPAAVPDVNNDGKTRISLDQLSAVMMNVRSAVGRWQNHDVPLTLRPCQTLTQDKWKNLLADLQKPEFADKLPPETVFETHPIGANQTIVALRLPFPEVETEITHDSVENLPTDFYDVLISNADRYFDQVGDPNTGMKWDMFMSLGRKCGVSVPYYDYRGTAHYLGERLEPRALCTHLCEWLQDENNEWYGDKVELIGQDVNRPTAMRWNGSVQVWIVPTLRFIQFGGAAAPGELADQLWDYADIHEATQLRNNEKFNSLLSNRGWGAYRQPIIQSLQNENAHNHGEEGNPGWRFTQPMAAVEFGSGACEEEVMTKQGTTEFATISESNLGRHMISEGDRSDRKLPTIILDLRLSEKENRTSSRKKEEIRRANRTGEEAQAETRMLQDIVREALQRLLPRDLDYDDRRTDRRWFNHLTIVFALPPHWLEAYKTVVWELFARDMQIVSRATTDKNANVAVGTTVVYTVWSPVISKRGGYVDGEWYDSHSQVPHPSMQLSRNEDEALLNIKGNTFYQLWQGDTGGEYVRRGAVKRDEFDDRLTADALGLGVQLWAFDFKFSVVEQVTCGVPPTISVAIALYTPDMVTKLQDLLNDFAIPGPKGRTIAPAVRVLLPAVPNSGSGIMHNLMGDPIPFYKYTGVASGFRNRLLPQVRVGNSMLITARGAAIPREIRKRQDWIHGSRAKCLVDARAVRVQKMDARGQLVQAGVGVLWLEFKESTVKEPQPQYEVVLANLVKRAVRWSGGDRNRDLQNYELFRQQMMKLYVLFENNYYRDPPEHMWLPALENGLDPEMIPFEHRAPATPEPPNLDALPWLERMFQDETRGFAEEVRGSAYTWHDVYGPNWNDAEPKAAFNTPQVAERFEEVASCVCCQMPMFDVKDPVCTLTQCGRIDDAGMPLSEQGHWIVELSKVSAMPMEVKVFLLNPLHKLGLMPYSFPERLKTFDANRGVEWIPNDNDVRAILQYETEMRCSLLTDMRNAREEFRQFHRVYYATMGRNLGMHIGVPLVTQYVSFGRNLVQDPDGAIMMAGYRTLSETIYGVVNGNDALQDIAGELERFGFMRRLEDPIGEMFSPTSLTEEEARELEEMRHSIIATERQLVTPMVNEETSRVFQQTRVQPRDYGNGPNSASTQGAKRLWRVQEENVTPEQQDAEAARRAQIYAQNVALLADKSEPHNAWKERAKRRTEENIRREQEEREKRLAEEKKLKKRYNDDGVPENIQMVSDEELFGKEEAERRKQQRSEARKVPEVRENPPPLDFGPSRGQRLNDEQAKPAPTLARDRQKKSTNARPVMPVAADMTYETIHENTEMNPQSPRSTIDDADFARELQRQFDAENAAQGKFAHNSQPSNEDIVAEIARLWPLGPNHEPTLDLLPQAPEKDLVQCPNHHGIVINGKCTHVILDGSKPDGTGCPCCHKNCQQCRDDARAEAGPIPPPPPPKAVGPTQVDKEIFDRNAEQIKNLMMSGPSAHNAGDSFYSTSEPAESSYEYVASEASTSASNSRFLELGRILRYFISELDEMSKILCFMYGIFRFLKSCFRNRFRLSQQLGLWKSVQPTEKPKENKKEQLPKMPMLRSRRKCAHANCDRLAHINSEYCCKQCKQCEGEHTRYCDRAYEQCYWTETPQENYHFAYMFTPVWPLMQPRKVTEPQTATVKINDELASFEHTGITEPVPSAEPHGEIPETEVAPETMMKYNSGFSKPTEITNIVFSLVTAKVVTRPEIPENIVRTLLLDSGIWDPGATADMGSVYSVALVDRILEQRSGGKLKGKWYRPTFPRQFRVANGETIPATYEVEFKIPLAKVPGKNFMKFRVAAVDTGNSSATQVPWLFSNESGAKIGAYAGSQTGKIICIDQPLLQGWKLQMKKSKSGHWLFPIVEAFIDLATPIGEQVPLSMLANDETGITEQGAEQEDQPATEQSNFKEGTVIDKPSDINIADAEPHRSTPEVNTDRGTARGAKRVTLAGTAEEVENFHSNSVKPALTEAFRNENCDGGDCCTGRSCADRQADAYKVGQSSTSNSDTRKLPFSQKTYTGVKGESDGNLPPFPQRMHTYLKQPTDLIVLTWELDGTYTTKHIKKAKTLPKPDKYGNWVRWSVRDECTGELLVDEYAPLRPDNAVRRVGVFSNNTNQVLLLKNKEGQYELPRGPVAEELFLKQMKGAVGQDLRKDLFVPIFSLASKTGNSLFDVYNVPIEYEGRKSGNGPPSAVWANPTAPSLEYWHDIEETSMKFLDCVGGKIKEVVDQKNMCNCCECLIGNEPPILTPPDQVPAGFEGYEDDEAWRKFLEYPAFISEELKDKYERISLTGPQFFVDAGNWVGVEAKDRPDHYAYVASGGHPWAAAEIPLIGMTEEELRAAVLTREGIRKLHHQFFHLQAEEMFRRIEPFVPAAKVAEVKSLCRQVVASCEACRKHRKPGNRPKIGGLWANDVGHIVACDTVFISYPADDYSKKPPVKGRKIAVLHMVDVFSGYSLAFECPGTNPKPGDVVACLRKWTERFGILPQVFYSDQGGEFTGHEFVSYLKQQGVRQMYSPPESPYTNGVNERHNGILKVWYKRIHADTPSLSFQCALREALRTKNATTRRFGFSSTFLAFGYKPEDELQVTIAEMIEPEWNPDARMQERIKARAAAHRAVAEFIHSDKLKKALENHLQNTDKTPLKEDMLVDYHVVPDGLTNKSYWEPNCIVLREPLEKASGKTIMIMKPNGYPARVSRSKLRPSRSPNNVQVAAIDFQKSDWDIVREVAAHSHTYEKARKLLAQNVNKPPNWEEELKKISGNEASEKVKDGQVPQEAVQDIPDNENPNKEQTVIDCVKELVAAQTDFVKSMTAFGAFGSGRRNPTRKEQNALDEFVAKTEPRGPHNDKFVRKIKKKIEEEEQERPSVKTKHTWVPQKSADPPVHPPNEDLPIQEPSAERAPEARRRSSTPVRESPSKSPVGSPKRSVSTPAKPSSLKKVATPFRVRAKQILDEREQAQQDKKKIKGTIREEAPRRSSRQNPDLRGSPLRELVDDRPSKLRTKLQESPGLKKFRTESVVRQLEKADAKRKEIRQKSIEEKRESQKREASTIRRNNEKAEKFNIGATPNPKKTVKDMAWDIEKEFDELDSRAPVPKGNHRGPGDGTEITCEKRDLQKEWEADGDDQVPSEGQKEDDAEDGGEGWRKDIFSDEEDGAEFVEDTSDAETMDMTEWIPPNFYTQINDKGDPEWTFWMDHPDIEQVLVPDAVFEKFEGNYPCLFAYLGNQAKVKLKPGREIPRTEALIDPEFWEAMIREIDQLLANGAHFAKPPQDGATFVYSSRWVYTYKEDGTRKARIVVRGFEEAWNPSAEDHATDSPTLHRDSIRLIAMTAASKRWKLQSWDIKTAFQQAMTRDDPDETQSEKEGLWIKLPRWFPGKYNVQQRELALKVPAGKTLYGMASAPRRWFFTLRKAMIDCGFESTRSDDCMFTYRNAAGDLQGIAGWHVDDGLLTGTKEFWDAMELVAKKLNFGKRAKDSFKFCGMLIEQNEDYSVKLSQTDMIELLKPITPQAHWKDKLAKATPAEITEMRGRIGAMLYLVGNTRPVESYAVSHLAGFINEARIVHLQNINALIQQFQSTKTQGIIYNGGCRVDYMYTFHDSSFKSERDSGSQMGILSYVGPPVDAEGKIDGVSLLRWASKRARRVCHSTLAAETLAATAGLDSQAGLAFRLAELDFRPKSVLLTDCRSLFDHIYAMTGKSAEMLLPDVHELREATMPWRHALSEEYTEDFVELWWCNTGRQLADSLTKVNTPSFSEFQGILEHNVVNLGKEGKGSGTEGKEAGYLRPRKTQQAHSFGVFEFLYYDVLRGIHENHNAHCPCGYITGIHSIGHQCELEVEPLVELQELWEEIRTFIETEEEVPDAGADV